MLTRTRRARLPVARAAALGAAGGLRSMLPFALLALAVRQSGPAPLRAIRRRQSWLVRALDSRLALVGLTTAAAGEVLADKLPFTPPRTRPPVFAQRVAVGALSGWLLATLERRSPWTMMLVGATAAGISAAAGTLGRRALSQATPVPQPAWGVVEDGLAVTLGARALGLSAR